MGRPTTCDLGCAHVLLPYFHDCAGSLAGSASLFEDAIALCRAAEETPALSFPGSQILTPVGDAALASFVTEAVGSSAAGQWPRCFSSFADDSSDPFAFHAQCDQHSPTVIVAQHGPVPQVGTSAAAGGHPEYDRASPDWVDGSSWVFGGLVRSKCSQSAAPPQHHFQPSLHGVLCRRLRAGAVRDVVPMVATIALAHTTHIARTAAALRPIISSSDCRQGNRSGSSPIQVPWVITLGINTQGLTAGRHGATWTWNLVWMVH